MTDHPPDFLARCPDCKAPWLWCLKASRQTNQPLDPAKAVTVDMDAKDDTPPWGLYDYPYGYRIRGKVLAEHEVSSAKRPVVCYPTHKCAKSAPAPGAPSGKDAAVTD
jgi:hypothetical protein